MAKPKDRHHIVPRAVCKRLNINPNFTGNVVRVPTSQHRAWHTLFGSKTPDEAIELIKAEWSLSNEGIAEFNRITNVRFFRSKR